jgi:iron(II)-dependent oxidoreductase
VTRPDDATLAAWVTDARARTLALVEDLDDAQLLGPRLAIVNPMRWEIGHVAWFQERWAFRRRGEPSQIAGADALYDSSAIPHDVRWDLPLPSRAATLAYLADARDRVLERIARGLDDEERYYVALGVFHEDMHDEAFAYTRQTLGYARPRFLVEEPAPAGRLAGDVEVPGGEFLLGAEPGREWFVFDNEKWAHPVRVAPFAIARAKVTQGEFAAFVDEGGYARDELWTPDGLAWRRAASAERPLHWVRDGLWLRRDFDRLVPLEPDRAMVHVSAHEAEAFCAWAGRRLPTEIEWEAAAACARAPDGTLALEKRRFPWGDAPPDAARANLGLARAGCLDVGALPASDSAFGCRQMIGDAWEWTSTAFAPFPGFVADPYRDYSQPWFGTHRVLRGGAFATQPRLVRNTWRNFYTPDRRDVWAGFRTCAR